MYYGIKKYLLSPNNLDTSHALRNMYIILKVKCIAAKACSHFYMLKDTHVLGVCMSNNLSNKKGFDSSCGGVGSSGVIETVVVTATLM